MSTEKTNLSSNNRSLTTVSSSNSEYHAALRHFYGEDEDKRDQRRDGQAYTPKTLRYLLPMLRNDTHAILYLHEEGDLSLKETLHGLCLLSKALGRPAILVLAEKDPTKAVRAILIFGQQCVVVETASDAMLTATQKAVLAELEREQVIQNVQYAQPLSSTLVDPKNSAPLLIEWLSKLLRQPLPALLQRFTQIEQAPSNVPCSLESLDARSFQFLKTMNESSLKKLRRRHESLLIDIPEKAVSSGQATSEEVFVQQCYEALPQRLLPRINKSFIKITEPLAIKSKQLRNLLWDERKAPLIEELKALAKQLSGSDCSSSLPASDIQQVKFLAEGGFGKVYEGLWSNTQVAIKILKEDAQPVAQEEFKNEVALMLQLKHPRIVQCYGLCLNPLQAVFEFMGGGSLESQLRENVAPKQPFLDWAVRKQILLDIGEAIHYLHAHHIVHGDLRTSNFLVDEQHRVKLGDFGLAKQRVGVMTVAFADVRHTGRTAWLAPELFSKSGARTFASDIYSFGMVIWELLTGYEPFCSEKGVLEEKAVEECVKKGEVLKYHALPADTPDWVMSIFKACLASNPAERPTMNEIVEVLCLAIAPQHYAKLYDTKTRVASPWLQQTLSLIQSVPQVSTGIDSSDDGGVPDSDEDEGISDSDEADQTVSATSSIKSSVSKDSGSSKNLSAGIKTNTPQSSRTSVSVNKPSPTLPRAATSIDNAIININLIHVDLTKKLGQGGFGAVYRGKYRGQDVAVKELLVQDFSPKAQQEFEWESKMMLQLRDPSVVHLYGVTAEKPYRMVLEFCELGPLDKYLHKRKVEEVSWDVRFHLSIGIASGLHYLHTYNPIIVHGDLKSLNVLLTGNPERPKTKIGDFGMAQLKAETQSKTTHTGSEGLTVSWAAPELFSLKGKKTAASDMYAFAITLWEIATHTYPYANCNTPAIIREAVKSGEREDIPENTPPLFSKVITDCWSQSSTDRPSAESVLTQLQTYESTIETKSIEKGDVFAASLSGGFIRTSANSSSESVSPVVSGSLKSSGSNVASRGSGISSSEQTVSSSRSSSQSRVSPLNTSSTSSTGKVSGTSLTSVRNTSVRIAGSSPVHSRTSSQMYSSDSGTGPQKEGKVKTSFFQAAKMGDQSKLSAYKELLDEGLSTQDSEGNTVLHHAAANGHLEMVASLVKEQGMNASERNQAEETPLLLAAQAGKQAVVEWLIQSGEVDEGERNSQGASALLLAAQQGHLGLVAWLLEKGVSKVTEKDKKQNTIFSSPKELVVLWATLYRDLLQTPDPINSATFEKIQAYKGEDAALLHFTTVKTLFHFGDKQLLKSHQTRVKTWWSAFSQAEKVVLSTLAASKQLEGFLPESGIQSAGAQPQPSPPHDNESSRLTTSSVQSHFFMGNKSNATPYPTNTTMTTTTTTTTTPVKVSENLPSIFQPESKKMGSHSEQVTEASRVVQDKINQTDLLALLKWATEGHLVEVEALLKKAPILALGTGTVKDLSDRTFKNITVLQYAAWALDAEMCELIINYLGAHKTSIQLNALANEPECYSVYGASYDFTPLVAKTKTYVDNYSKWNNEQRVQYWQKEVGREQRKCPAWLIYAWCEEGEDVAWTKKDVKRPIKREYDKHRLEWWFTQNAFNNGRGVGSTWACVRGSGGRWGWEGRSQLPIAEDEPKKSWYGILQCTSLEAADLDRQLVKRFTDSRRENLQRLKATLDSQLGQVSMGLGKRQ